MSTILGKLALYLAKHKHIRKVFVGNFAAIVIATSFLPAVKASDTAVSNNIIIQNEVVLPTKKEFQSPIEDLKINQKFSKFHPGIDIGAPIGEPVKAITTGIVVEANYAQDYGITILINHGDGLISRYAHLSKIEVKVGDNIDMATEIGKVGLTGHTTGPHLHLEVHQDGVAINPLTVI
ncbi:MAG TPA: M23 family metallopeptidase [Alphaproteobacteria bacterium]|jgi:murein DD-endopeptidase MepM/ murein hydrolase activator NlpD|nr:M23 family metallopeptidase [Alphaproteobacteria bacterium]